MVTHLQKVCGMLAWNPQNCKSFLCVLFIKHSKIFDSILGNILLSAVTITVERCTAPRFFLEVIECATMFSEGGFALKSPTQIKTTGGNLLNTYRNFSELPLTLSVPEVAKVLGISRSGAYELVRSAGFPHIRIGNRIVVPRDKFIAWIDQQTEVSE